MSPENINAGATKVDHHPDVLVWLSRVKRPDSPRLDVRGVVCCSQPVLLSNSYGLDGTVSCQAGQSSLLNQTAGFSCSTVSLSLSYFSTIG